MESIILMAFDFYIVQQLNEQTLIHFPLGKRYLNSHLLGIRISNPKNKTPSAQLHFINERAKMRVGGVQCLACSDKRWNTESHPSLCSHLWMLHNRVLYLCLADPPDSILISSVSELRPGDREWQMALLCFFYRQ